MPTSWFRETYLFFLKNEMFRSGFFFFKVHKHTHTEAKIIKIIIKPFLSFSYD